MQVKFWGTRGSIAKPGPDYVRYGGNTSCVEIRSDADTLIVLDCGTGGHGLGQQLCSEQGGAINGHMLVSHTHWDHIQGIPFFAPLFISGNVWNIYGPKGLSQSLRTTLAGQMEHTYFPVALEQFAANIHYHDLVEGTFTVGDIKVTTRYLNHPALTLGYRLESDGASVVYCCDHEPHSAALASGEAAMSGGDSRYAEFVAGADLVIHDAQYTALEFAAKVGWGHSSGEYAVRVCRDAGVRKLILTHHDPLREDTAVDRILAALRTRLQADGSTLEVVSASEGLTLQLHEDPNRPPVPAKEFFPAQASIDTSSLTNPVLLCVSDSGMMAILSGAIASESVPHQVVLDGATLPAKVRMESPSLVIVEHDPPRADALAIVRAIRDNEEAGKVKVPIVIVAAHDNLSAAERNIATDTLIAPFSLSYARSRIHAWVLRIASRWVRAQLPRDEGRRIQALNDLRILDTPPEERFDRLTRVAAAAFGAPIALVSLVDSQRQWFKSRVGLAAKETARDMAFCAHVVNMKQELVVPDTMQDERFADNPLVQEEPRIRFYAGAPLIMGDGSCIGTLCVIDTRPRDLDATGLAMLRDLRDVAVAEITRNKG